MKTFQAEILTPQKVFFSGPVEALVLKGASGYFGVLAGHAPLIARLAPGRLKLVRDGKESFYQAGAGFAQVSPPATLGAALGAGKERVSVLLDDIK